MYQIIYINTRKKQLVVNNSLQKINDNVDQQIMAKKNLTQLLVHFQYIFVERNHAGQLACSS